MKHAVYLFALLFGLPLGALAQIRVPQSPITETGPPSWLGQTYWSTPRVQNPDLYPDYNVDLVGFPARYRLAYWNASTGNWDADSILSEIAYGSEGVPARIMRSHYQTRDSTLQFFWYDGQGRDTLNIKYQWTAGRDVGRTETRHHYAGPRMTAYVQDKYDPGQAVRSYNWNSLYEYDELGRIKFRTDDSYYRSTFTRANLLQYLYPTASDSSEGYRFTQSLYENQGRYSVIQYAGVKWQDYAQGLDTLFYRYEYQTQTDSSHAENRVAYRTAYTPYGSIQHQKEADGDLITEVDSTVPGRHYFKYYQRRPSYAQDTLRSLAVAYYNEAGMLDSTVQQNQAEYGSDTKVAYRSDYTYADGRLARDIQHISYTQYLRDSTQISQHPTYKVVYLDAGVSALSDPLKQAIGVYPNPAGGWVTVRMPSLPGPVYELKVYDAQGRLRKSHKTGGLTSSLSVAHLEPGLYTVRCEEAGRVWTGRFVKQ